MWAKLDLIGALYHEPVKEGDPRWSDPRVTRMQDRITFSAWFMKKQFDIDAKFFLVKMILTNVYLECGKAAWSRGVYNVE